MSLKAKDLQFDNSQPAFLRRLRGELAGDDSARHERPLARNKKAKDDEDDAPAYVLEGTNQSMTKEEYEAFISEKESKDADADAETKTGDSEQAWANEGETKPKDKPTAGLTANAKKRKAVKIISDETEESKGGAKEATSGTKTIKKAKKKGKSVKLTFGDEEEG